jgi:hypothetical protein
MNDEKEQELVIKVDFEDFVTRLDLDEILSSIDRIIEMELFREIKPELHLWEEFFGVFPAYKYGQPKMTYLGIRSINSGSLIIGAFIGGAVLAYVGTRFAKGVDESLLADELKRSGRITGDALGRILVKVNDWAEQYVRKQKEKGGNIRGIRADQPRRDDGERSQNS